MNAFAKKIATASIAAATIGATVALSVAPAEAKFGRKRALWTGVGIGIVGAGLLGAHAYHHGGYGYYGSCWREKRPVYNAWGDFRGYRYIRVCN